MNCAQIWISCLAALLTPIIAVLGAVITYRQWKLAQNKLKLDLFDRRFTIYEAARNFISSLLTSGKAKDDEVFKFLVATREAKWILNAQVAEYLDKQIYQQAILLQALSSELEGGLIGDERALNVRKQTEIKKWLFAQQDTLDKHFSSFLQLEHK